MWSALLHMHCLKQTLTMVIGVGGVALLHMHCLKQTLTMVCGVGGV